jgi:hypothetical protein
MNAQVGLTNLLYYWSRRLSFEFTQNICTSAAAVRSWTNLCWHENWYHSWQSFSQLAETKQLLQFLAHRFGFGLFNFLRIYLYAWRRGITNAYAILNANYMKAIEEHYPVLYVGEKGKLLMK